VSMPGLARASAAAGMALAGVLGAWACAPSASTVAAPAVRCEVGDTMLVRDVVYFGRNRPDGGTVSDEEWRAFLDGVVTPRFPKGLTLVEATGQWKGQAGAVEQERSEIVTLLHTGDQAARDAVAAIAAEYKRRFAQEAVLRERTTTCARFE
jgi:uncharacterized protein DUF3574